MNNLGCLHVIFIFCLCDVYSIFCFKYTVECCITVVFHLSLSCIMVSGECFKWTRVAGWGANKDTFVLFYVYFIPSSKDGRVVK